MKGFKYLIGCCLLAFVLPGYSKITYCKGSKPSPGEDTLLQQLIPSFAKSQGCEIEGCVQRWGIKNLEGQEKVSVQDSKFSVVWKKPCGQLRDSRRGSTFTCVVMLKNELAGACCLPLGFKLDRYLVCQPKLLHDFIVGDLRRNR
jgi:hypothetical protein